MKNLRSVEEISAGMNVIVRMDTDLPIDNGVILDNSRLMKSIPTIRWLLEKNCRLMILGHRGRPEGVNENLSLKGVYLELMNLLENDQNTIESIFIDDIQDDEKIAGALVNNQIIFGENLRFWSEEEKGETSMFEVIKKRFSVLVNDAFAVAHRRNASVILHREVETYYGFSFIEEAEKINEILEKKQQPITVILGGAKEDKLNYLPELEEIADHILIGGKLPKLDIRQQMSNENNKILWAGLREDGLDLSKKDVAEFGEIIKQSKTIVWAGAMGMYEAEDSREGTNEIAKMVAETDGYKIIAGGDTGASIKNLGLKNKIDFICSGGGVMLEMLTKGDLPAWN
ncbi:MAG TPA: phosphoglycerate kinase [Candidatus Woesebacteria bacterium]|nr:phosphoglycerate kinase [Candidatus Woesebacteria bacterium]